MCAQVCTECGEECAGHPMDQCQACARACHGCAQELDRRTDEFTLPADPPHRVEGCGRSIRLSMIKRSFDRADYIATRGSATMCGNAQTPSATSGILEVEFCMEAS
jgi:hypothetical protein